MMDLAQELGSNFSGPLIFDYVWWLLREAQRRGIRRLYFLARDGYTLHRTALLFCEKFDLDIECRYLYCSRMALRMPSYFFIGEEAFELLLLWGYHVTPKSVLQRGELTEEERRAVYAECGVIETEEDRCLTRKEFEDYAGSLRRSSALKRYIFQKSEAAYGTAIGYFRQEGLFDGDTVAIVDSGWTGSMQRSLRQLLEFAGYTGKLVGFYFGMYAAPRMPADGTYLTWYFDAWGAVNRKMFFCNNLFECLLSAPHGMTRGYADRGTHIEPVLLPAPMGAGLEAVERQSAAIGAYAAARVERISFNEFDAGNRRKAAFDGIKRYMFKPTQEEAEYYGQFLFCDDVTEAYHMTLASREQKALLRCYNVPYRVLHNLLKRMAKTETRGDLFWPSGVIAFLPAGQKLWYRLNVSVWEWLKYTLQQQGGWRKPSAPTDWEKLTEPYDTVSFDIFDTLLYRTVNCPTTVFYLMESVARKRFGIEDFAAKRIAAEQRARVQSAKEDVTLAEIYETMELADETTRELMQWEMDTELTVLKRDELMTGLLEHCVKQGKRVLIISDMYQSGAFLRKALAQCGICGYSALYVSSEEGTTKASSSLFRRIAEKEKITDRTQWLHIGDNPSSDVLAPRAVGLAAAQYCNGRNAAWGREAPLTRIVKRMLLAVKSRPAAR